MQGMQKVRVGQSMGDGFPAHVYNSMIDVINAYRRGQLTNLGSWGDTIRSSGVVHLENNTGGNLARMAVVGIDQPLVLPTTDLDEFKDRVRLTGVIPTAEDHVPDRFAVLREPIENGTVGLATVSGVCQVQVDVQNDNHGFAGCTDGVTSGLTSRMYGGARILWKESGLGTKNAVVRIGPPPQIAIVQVSGTLCVEIERDTGTCLWSGNILSIDTTSTCTPWSSSEAIWILEINACDTQGAKPLTKIRGEEPYIGACMGAYENGGDVRELYVVRNTDIGKVRVNHEDELDWLEDQYRDHVDPPEYVEGDLLVKSQTDIVGVDRLVRRFVDATNYNSNEQALTHPGGADTPTWLEVQTVTVVTDLRLYNNQLEMRRSQIKVLGETDLGWSEAFPSTEC